MGCTSEMTSLVDKLFNKNIYIKMLTICVLWIRLFNEWVGWDRVVWEGKKILKTMSTLSLIFS